jgi:hypothetical protein
MREGIGMAVKVQRRESRMIVAVDHERDLPADAWPIIERWGERLGPECWSVRVPIWREYLREIIEPAMTAAPTVPAARSQRATASVHIHPCVQCGDPVLDPRHRLCLDCYRAERGY